MDHGSSCSKRRLDLYAQVPPTTDRNDRTAYIIHQEGKRSRQQKEIYAIEGELNRALSSTATKRGAEGCNARMPGPHVESIFIG